MIRYLVFGMGDTGLSVARFFEKTAVPARYYDTRLNPPNLSLFNQLSSQSEIVLGTYTDKLFENINLIVRAYPLHHGGQTLQSHPGIHRGFG